MEVAYKIYHAKRRTFYLGRQYAIENDEALKDFANSLVELSTGMDRNKAYSYVWVNIFK